ncbi:hypothetical protein HGB07_04260 [Candidatus Roizmanbacteria bacterium]|nr:hypothetical protein [Candidatus Roizmanbacteria bacterium]
MAEINPIVPSFDALKNPAQSAPKPESPFNKILSRIRTHIPDQIPTSKARNLLEKLSGDQSDTSQQQTSAEKSEIKAEEKLPPTVAFYCGFSGTDQGIRSMGTAVENVLRDEYEKANPGQGTAITSENVKIYNSAVSVDRPNPNRFKEMGAHLMKSLSEGRDTTVILYSMGSAEFVGALQWIASSNPDFIKNTDFSKLHIMLLSPAGIFKGARGALDTIGAMKDLVKTTNEKSPYLGIDVAIAFPPQGITHQDFVQALRLAYPELSATTNDTNNQIEWTEIPKDQRDYYRILSESDKVAVELIDTALAQGIANKNSDVIKARLAQRATLLNKYSGQIYKGQHFEESSIQKAEVTRFQMAKLIGQGLLGAGDVFKNVFFGKQRQVYELLMKAGADVSIAAPEYDVFNNPIKLADLLSSPQEPDKAPAIFGIPGGTHTSFAPKPERTLGEIVRKSLQKTFHQYRDLFSDTDIA